MNKYFVLSLLLGTLIFSSGLVLAANQDVDGTVLGTVDFTLETPAMHFGSVPAGTDSAPQQTELTIGENNNVDYQVNIALNSDPNTLFQNIFFDLDGSGFYEADEQLDQTLMILGNDPAGNAQAIVIVDAILRVPTGFPPGSSTGVITYTVVPQTF